jgi:hypothetical protein
MATKMVDLGVNEFHLMIEVSLMCFFTLEFPKKRTRSKLGKSFDFKLI